MAPLPDVDVAGILEKESKYSMHEDVSEIQIKSAAAAGFFVPSGFSS